MSVSEIEEICRQRDDSRWYRVANPTRQELKHALFWLENLSNEYLEYSNDGGVVTRYIRRENLSKYLHT